ncbi:tetratricopeptide repeat protein [Tautonia plasticadhaerens]|uniref:Uncharacterized protein n=1 Tax=Tautonia plasticadhaerens TaxID=2527974 RepID=A0A518GVT0_9BACT|nr:tetratricopeptide repeat protein [Tautonia plasticadhaerens]QDV32700.1 hypothetical protein ElP_05390 [Tautonia plasticadhaerens]
MPDRRSAIRLLVPLVLPLCGITRFGLADESTARPPVTVTGACVPRPPVVIPYAPRVVLLPSTGGLVPYAPPIFVTPGRGGPWVTIPPAFPAPPVVPLPIGASPVLFPFPAAPIPGDPGQGGGIPAERPRAGDGPDPRDAGRAAELLTFGDRNFRAADLRRADRRYRQAMRAAPLSAPPRARLAQVAFVRGEYREAADRLREAIAADPRWLLRARDVQALHAEPADFHDALASLEAHLQAEPDDRDAWLVLGTQLLLSDRIDRAADVVLRLDDRRSDALLAALREASGVDR